MLFLVAKNTGIKINAGNWKGEGDRDIRRGKEL